MNLRYEVCSMNFFERILYMLQGTMEEPTSYGWFHLMWIIFIFGVIIVLFKFRNRYSERQLKLILGVYGIVAFVLELTKQLIWSFNYDITNNMVTWDYTWYAAPFQLCTTPIYVSLICLFLKDGKVRSALLSYMAYITILGGFMTMIIPDSCFVETILVNIHTMWLHCGSFVVSIYLLISGIVKINIKSWINGCIVFIIFVGLAELLNVGIYNLGILNGETFNMFYISPYFISDLPIYDIVQQNVPFVIYLILYILSICFGSFIVYRIARIFKR